MKKLGLLAIGVCALGATPAAGDAGPSDPAADWLEVSAHIALPDGGQSVGLGQPFRLIIEARHPPGGLALLPGVLSLGEQVAERRSGRAHSRQGGAVEIDRYELELLAFEPGDLTIPSIQLALGSTTASTDPIDLYVETGFSEEELPVATSTQPQAVAELEQMAAQDPAPRVIFVDDYTLVWVGGTVVFVGLLAWLLWWIVRRSSAAAEVRGPPPKPPRPAHEVALERLGNLERAGHLEAERHKTFFVELSAILREYTGARYDFDSLDLTLDELFEVLAHKPTPNLDTTKLRHILGGADMVKFAKYRPDAKEGSDALSGAFEIVRATRRNVE